MRKSCSASFSSTREVKYVRLTWMSIERSNFGVYFGYLHTLLRPSVQPPDRTQAVHKPSLKLDELSEEDLDMLIAEGRRTLDQQSGRFDRIRHTAQVMLPLSVALLIVVSGEWSRIRVDPDRRSSVELIVLWIVASLLVLLGVLGAAANLVVRAGLGKLVPSELLTKNDGLSKKSVADAYVEQTDFTNGVIDDRLKLHWYSVLFVLIGGLVFAAEWILRTRS